MTHPMTGAPMETREEIERRLMRLRQWASELSPFLVEEVENIRTVCTLVESLLPSLDVAEAAVALRHARHELSINAADSVPLAAVAEDRYDAALARYVAGAGEGGRSVNYVSLFSGIEAASVAWLPLGWTPLAFAEIDAFPSAVLKHHYPDVPNHGDVTAFDWSVYRGQCEILVGGSPCQSFSVAGLRGSLADARGNLALAYCMVVHEIDPAVVVYENVPGILSTKDNAFGCFLAGLVGEGEPLVCSEGSWPDAGMVAGPVRTAAWRVLDAQYFGLAQRRRRVFVVSFRTRDGGNPGAVLLEPESVPRNTAPGREAGEEIAATITSGAHPGGHNGQDDHKEGRLIPTAFNWQSGGDCRINPSNDLANGLQRDQTQAVAFQCHGSNVGPMGTLRGGNGNEAGGVPFIAFDTTQISSKSNYSNPKPGDPCHPLASGAHPPAVAFAIQERAVSENPDNGPQGRGWQEGHAFTLEARNKVQAVAFNANRGNAFAHDIAPGVGATTGGNGSKLSVMPSAGMAVRRLTPRECERLQGFPDDYSLVPYRGKPAADGPRYRALGNSMAVPVLRWIGERIIKVLAAMECEGRATP